MAGSSGEKTEQPTPKKLRDARQKGQVAKSKEIAGSLGLIGIFAYILMRKESLEESFLNLYLAAGEVSGLSFEAGFSVMTNALAAVSLQILGPILAIALLAALIGNIVQTGVLFSVQAVSPDLNKVNPAQGIKKIVSTKNFINFGKEIIKVLLLGLIVFIAIRGSINDLMLSGYCGLDCSGAVLLHISTQVIVYSMAIFAISAGIDYALERWQYINGLKMTKDEVKREYKEMEGDPQIKGRRRQLHRELISSNQIGNVKNASVVVTNPTHLAIALRYVREETPLPLVIAKGEHLTAQQIVDVAEENDVPITQNIDLARALYDQAEVDNLIPSDLIEPVAEVLRWVRRIAKERNY